MGREDQRSHENSEGVNGSPVILVKTRVERVHNPLGSPGLGPLPERPQIAPQQYSSHLPGYRGLPQSPQPTHASGQNTVLLGSLKTSGPANHTSWLFSPSTVPNGCDGGGLSGVVHSWWAAEHRRVSHSCDDLFRLAVKPWRDCPLPWDATLPVRLPQGPDCPCISQGGSCGAGQSASPRPVDYLGGRENCCTWGKSGIK